MIFKFNQSSAKKSRGFTLLEVLIAIAIFSVISLTGFTLFDTVLKSDEHSKAKTVRLNELQRAFLIIERDIMQIARRTVRFEGEAPAEGFLHVDDNNTGANFLLAFVRHGWKNPALMLPRGDMQLVAYQVNENILERVHFNYVDAVTLDDAKIRPLITDVEEVTFEYWDGQMWQQEYQQSMPPLAIAIIVKTLDYGEIRRQFLVAGEKAALANGEL